MSALSAFTTSAVVPDYTTFPGIAIITYHRANAAINAGIPVYELNTTYPHGVSATDSDASAAAAKVIGLTLSTAAAAGQEIAVMRYGLLTVGGSQTKGEWVWIHPTAGALTITWADLDSDDYPSLVGYFYSATQLFICPRIALVTKAA